MKNQLTLFIGILIVAVLTVYMFAFTVRYDQVAVVTTFDRAEPPTYDAQSGEIIDPGSVQYEPGLQWRLPWPIQKVYKYSNRIQLLEDQLEEQQTADGYSVIVRTYLAWKIEDPLAFFVKLKDVEEAQRQLNPLLRDVRGLISLYRFDQLVNTDESKLKLEEIQDQAKAQLQRRIAQQGYGITVEQVGLRRLMLPENVTEQVFERMRATRTRIAADARSSGRAQAAAITSEADSAKQIILAFAERRAEAIRAEGDQEAARSYEIFSLNEPFAIFLRKIQALEKMLAHNTTFVLDAKTLSPLEMFSGEDQAVAGSR